MSNSTHFIPWQRFSLYLSYIICSNCFRALLSLDSEFLEERHPICLLTSIPISSMVPGIQWVLSKYLLNLEWKIKQIQRQKWHIPPRKISKESTKCNRVPYYFRETWTVPPHRQVCVHELHKGSKGEFGAKTSTPWSELLGPMRPWDHHLNNESMDSASWSLPSELLRKLDTQWPFGFHFFKE